MSQDEFLVPRCWRLVRRDPWQALVLLWSQLRQQGNLDEGFERRRCEEQAEAATRALFDEGDELPTVHPAAALRAVDEYLCAQEAANAALARRVELPAGDAFFVVPRRPGWVSDFAAGQAGHLQYWMRRHQVVPRIHRGITVEIWRPADRLLNLLARPRIPFAAGGFLDGVLPAWTESSPYRCHCLTDPARRWTSVEALLADAQGRGASIVVLPELTIDGEVRDRLCTWLQERPRSSPFALVVAGSFHEDDSGSPEGPGPRRNAARVFDGYGQEIVKQLKLRPMRAAPKPERRATDEDVEPGRKLRLIHAGFGLIAVAICLDFFETGDVPVADLWTMVGPALVLVASMGDETTNHGHRQRANDLRRQHGTAVIVASQHPEDSDALGLFWDRRGTEAEAKPVLQGVLEWTDL